MLRPPPLPDPGLTASRCERKLPILPEPTPLAHPRSSSARATHQSTAPQRPPRACSCSGPKGPQHNPTGKAPCPCISPHPARCSHFPAQTQPSAVPRGQSHSPAADTPPPPLPGSRSHHTPCPRSPRAKPPLALSTPCLLPSVGASLCLKRQQHLLLLPLG